MTTDVLITGGTGFVGRALVNQLSADKHWRTKVAVRSSFRSDEYSSTIVTIPGLYPETNWGHALSGVSIVIHLAARVHVMNEKIHDPLTEFRRINLDGTLQLASQAADCGVKRFIFISTIKVNGELTANNTAFTADDDPDPLDDYALSKWEAEQGLMEIGRKTGMEIVIIRPPLVYGPGVKGNFLSLMKVVSKRYPLPLASVSKNKRSLVYVDNLVDLIITCMNHPAAANQVFLVSDENVISTAALLDNIAQIMNQSNPLLPFPTRLLKIIAVLLGQRKTAERLIGSLQVDITKTRELLGWNPVVTFDEGIKKTVAKFQAENK
jgi:nucleoside-diphosphate-sugar epimerase